jgi:Zn-dependent protease with chaperone function
MDFFGRQAETRRLSRWMVFLFVLAVGGIVVAINLVVVAAIALATQDGGDLALSGATIVRYPGIVLLTSLVVIGTIAGASVVRTVALAAGGGGAVAQSLGGTRIAADTSDPLRRRLRNVVEEMAIASGLPKPKIWIVPDRDPNAFATGTDPRAAHIAVTEGLLSSLSRDELQAVIAHEMSHVRNDDVKLMTLLAALVGVLALISEGVGRSLRHGRFNRRSGGSRGGGGKKDGGALIVVLVVVWLISVLLAPLVSRLLALAVSRKREYLADATAAQFTRNPAALADALQKIEHAAAPTSAIKGGSAHLCIADPLGRRVTSKEGLVADLLGTHPPMATRIARLRQMAYQYEKTGVLPEPA